MNTPKEEVAELVDLLTSENVSLVQWRTNCPHQRGPGCDGIYLDVPVPVGEDGVGFVPSALIGTVSCSQCGAS